MKITDLDRYKAKNVTIGGDAFDTLEVLVTSIDIDVTAYIFLSNSPKVEISLNLSYYINGTLEDMYDVCHLFRTMTPIQFAKFVDLYNFKKIDS